MPKSKCENCGGPYYWIWEDAFDKFGFGDGDGQVETPTVADVLEEAGYVVEHDYWGLHNDVISSIKKHGVEQIPDGTDIGYDGPRKYLPAAIIKLLDEMLPVAEGVRQ